MLAIVTLLVPDAGTVAVLGADPQQDAAGRAAARGLHAGLLRALRRADLPRVPRLLRLRLRPHRRRATGPGRRPARAGRAVPQGRHRHLGAVARDAAAAVAGPGAGARPASCSCSTNRPPAWTRGPGSSCARSCASSPGSATRSSCPATSSPSSRRSATGSGSSRPAPCSRRARPTSCAAPWPRRPPVTVRVLGGDDARARAVPWRRARGAVQTAQRGRHPALRGARRRAGRRGTAGGPGPGRDPGGRLPRGGRRAGTAVPDPDAWGAAMSAHESTSSPRRRLPRRPGPTRCCGASWSNAGAADVPSSWPAPTWVC